MGREQFEVVCMCRDCITEADLFAGKKLREIRKSRGFSQMTLAEALGVSFQQIQKYERGTNRISIGKIYMLAKFFNVPELYFFKVPSDEYMMMNN